MRAKSSTLATIMVDRITGSVKHVPNIIKYNYQFCGRRFRSLNHRDYGNNSNEPGLDVSDVIWDRH